MPGRWNDASAFRADPAVAPAGQPSRRQSLALLAVVALVAGAVAAAAYLVRPERARAFDLFHGSLFLADQKSPVAIDLASGKPTLRLLGADKQVGITGRQTLGVVPVEDGTLLLNQSSGEFNMVSNGGFVVKHTGGGVPLPKRAGPTSAFGLAATDGQAYIVRTAPTGGTDLYLVGQPTVEAAINAKTSVRPRASATLPRSVSAAPGGAASANGDLWTLSATPTPDRETINQLSVPANSSAGATLDVGNRGSTTGPVAIGTATIATGPLGAGPLDAGPLGTAAIGAAAAGTPTVVGVASAGRIRLFTPGAAAQTKTFRAPAGVDAVLPTTGDQGRLAFLLHGLTGWSIVSIGADGTGLRAPQKVAGLPPDARPAPPAVSNGRLYLIDHRDGRIYRIGYDGRTDVLPGARSYPLSSIGGRVVEPIDFGDVYVVARGGRVVFNSPVHADALMVFADGSRAPLRIAKSSAVTVNASGGAEALTKSTVTPNQQAGPTAGAGQSKPKQQAAAQINNKIDCKTAIQKPHIPVITSSVPGSRSVALNWNYPVLDPQDCFPSTYVVSARLVGGDAPQPPQSVEVQSQTGTNLTGLFPSTQYDITVTAYIHGLGTDSAPRRITTGTEGPAAPSDVAVTAGGTGNWTVHWTSCGDVAQGCVPAQSWTITPSFCDGRGLSAPPSPVTVTADPTARVQAPATYPGRDDVLGRGLQFQVQGTGEQGQAGSPSARSACVYSWATPVAADLSVQASSPPATSSSVATTATTATVTFAKGQVHDLGGVGGTLTYELLSDGAVVDQRGPTSDPSVALSGIRAGRRYQVQVQASPPGHPEVMIDIGTVDVAPAAAEWPAVSVSTPSFDSPAGASGTLHVSFAFPPGTDSRGETFDLTGSQLTCGNTALTLTKANVGPSDPLTFPVNRAVYNGVCTVTIQLAQDSGTSTDPPLYGAGSSKAVTSGPVDIPAPSLTATAGDFDARWGGSISHPTVVVSYHGSDPLSGATGWQLTVSNGTAECGGVTGDSPPVTIDVDPACAQPADQLTVTIDFTYFLLGSAHFVIPVSGNAPGPVDPSKISFTAAWNGDPQSPEVVVTYTGSAPTSTLSSLEWTESVTSSGSPGTCGPVGHDNPTGSSVHLDVDLAGCPPTVDGTPSTYSVEISFTDPDSNQTGDYKYAVTGAAPK